MADSTIEIARTNLRMAIALRNLNSSETSRRAGLSRNAVSQFVSGRTTLSYQNMLRVCAVLQLPIGLLHRKDGITGHRIQLYDALEKDSVFETHCAELASKNLGA